jgi:hypothetical protein
MATQSSTRVRMQSTTSKSKVHRTCGGVRPAQRCPHLHARAAELCLSDLSHTHTSPMLEIGPAEVDMPNVFDSVKHAPRGMRAAIPSQAQMSHARLLLSPSSLLSSAVLRDAPAVLASLPTGCPCQPPARLQPHAQVICEFATPLPERKHDIAGMALTEPLRQN